MQWILCDFRSCLYAFLTQTRRNLLVGWRAGIQSRMSESCIKIRAEVARLSMLNILFKWISYGLAVLALAASLGLLIGDAGIESVPRLSAAASTAAPLLLVGTSFLFLQLVLRPRLVELLRNVLLAAAFVLWGIVQLMPRNAISMRLGNVVIALYVFDLAWMTLGSAISRGKI